MVTLFLWESPPQILLPDARPLDESLLFPYAVIDTPHSRHFDQKGKLSYEFSATTLKHFRIDLSKISERDFTTLEAPLMTLYAEDNAWYVSAEIGRVTEQGTLLKLLHNVKVWQKKDDGDTLELTTDELWIYPNEKIVRTDAKVKIRSTLGFLEATGMIVNLADKHIQLMSNVRGHHEPI
jgi:LPS export ABC transporter protein LptC